MRMPGLAIIFILIILPIIIIMNEYIKTQSQIYNIEQEYDRLLITSTNDALNVFKINTFNATDSDIADKKMHIIEASANSFFTSMEAGFKIQGYSKKDLQTYVPALVYTMYDGYYIYSPYTNVAELDGNVNINLNSNNMQYGFKPYVYYSCRYVKGTDDFIITYTLDNYITVQGMIGGEIVNKSGYLITIGSDGVKVDNRNTPNEKWYYNGIEIKNEETLTENLVETDGSIKTYEYIKLNGAKYYLDEDKNRDGIKDDGWIFHLSGKDRIEQAKDNPAETDDLYDKYKEKIKHNTSAIAYYRDAYDFTTWINEKLGYITSSDAELDILDKGSDRIFDNYHIEYENSKFNTHRKNVIRYAIETNLSIAIANFNKYTTASANFQMPRLKDTDWDLLENEISIISFLQGLNMGGKLYNGYTVVTNNKNEEVVDENRIYMVTDDEYYHKINDEHLLKSNGYLTSTNRVKIGILDLDFEIRTDGTTGYKYTNRNETGCYTSIITQKTTDNTYDSIYEYLRQNKSQIDDYILQEYYTALGREKWSQITNNFITLTVNDLP